MHDHSPLGLRQLEVVFSEISLAVTAIYRVRYFLFRPVLFLDISLGGMCFRVYCSLYFLCVAEQNRAQQNRKYTDFFKN
jgi:hypothetical protein